MSASVTMSHTGLEPVTSPPGTCVITLGLKNSWLIPYGHICGIQLATARVAVVGVVMEPVVGVIVAAVGGAVAVASSLSSTVGVVVVLLLIGRPPREITITYWKRKWELPPQYHIQHCTQPEHLAIRTARNRAGLKAIGFERQILYMVAHNRHSKYRKFGPRRQY